jgi:esterase/lipase superfamily enzyme
VRTIDKLYVSLANRKPFFSQGWGDSRLLEHILTTDPLRLNHGPAARVPPIEIQWAADEKAKIENGAAASSAAGIREGRFQSPFRYEWRPRQAIAEKRGRARNGRPAHFEAKHQSIVHTLPEPVQTARLQLIVPEGVENPPLVLHFAATGDEGFSRRRAALAEPLLRLGIASAILENPFYGSRRMPGRDSSNSATVQELLQMSRAAQDEALALLRVFRAMGFRRLGVTGVSMGGYMALAVSARHPEPLAVAACIPSHSASPVYTEGILSGRCDWAALERSNPFADRYNPRELLGHILDASDLRHLAPPPAPEACVIVGGRRDAYIPAYSTAITHHLRPGSQLHWIDMGHVSSFIFGRGAFLNAIRESFQRLEISIHKTKAKRPEHS